MIYLFNFFFSGRLIVGVSAVELLQLSQKTSPCLCIAKQHRAWKFALALDLKNRKVGFVSNSALSFL